jgi:hypothetical protein
MAERTIREAHWGYYSFVVKSGEVCEKGNVAAFNATGEVVNAPGAMQIGYWHETKNADGIIKVQVKLWREIQLQWMDNETVSPVAITDRGKLCNMKTNHSVTMDVAVTTKAGIVFDVQAAKGVLVFFSYDTAA